MPTKPMLVKTDPQSEPPLDKSILLIGDFGSGKTHFLGTCPRPIWIADFDKGAATLEDDMEDIEVHVFQDAYPGREGIPSVGLYSFGTAWLEFQDALNVLGRQIDEGICPFRTIALDTFTSMQEVIFNYVMANISPKRRSEGRLAKEQSDYGTLLDLQRKMFADFKVWPLLKVLTAHIERQRNTISENVEKLPLGDGKFPSLLPSYFDEVYYIDVQSGADGPVRTLITEPDSFVKQARTRRKVPTGTPLDFAAIEPYLRSRGAM